MNAGPPLTAASTRIGYSRHLVSEIFVDEHTGLEVAGLDFTLRFDQKFLQPTEIVGEPDGAHELNSMIRVEYSPGVGLTFHVDPTLTGLWDVADYEVSVRESFGCTGVPVSRETFERILHENPHSFVQDRSLQNLSYRLYPCER